MNYASADIVPLNRIPVVDISGLRDGTDSLGVAKALIAASQNPGFIYVRGHGIPDELIDAARAAAFRFFRQDETVKEAVRVSNSHRGWLSRGGAKMQDDAKPDLKESFIWGFEDRAGETPLDHELRGPNRWPDSVPELHDLAMRYFEEAHTVARDLMRGFAMGLGLSEEFFLKSCDVPLSRASFVWYPQQDASMGEDQFGVGPHTDFGVLTVLCQDDVGGLQVQDVSGAWIEAPPIEGTLVVNVGDLLARWTDNLCKSTPHRVVNRSNRERLSLVLAFDPDPQTMIDQRAVFGPDHTPSAEPITCGDYLIWRFAKAFDYRNRKPEAPNGKTGD